MVCFLRAGHICSEFKVLNTKLHSLKKLELHIFIKLLILFFAAVTQIRSQALAGREERELVVLLLLLFFKHTGLILRKQTLELELTR